MFLDIRIDSRSKFAPVLFVLFIFTAQYVHKRNAADDRPNETECSQREADVAAVRQCFRRRLQRLQCHADIVGLAGALPIRKRKQYAEGWKQVGYKRGSQE